MTGEDETDTNIYDIHGQEEPHEPRIRGRKARVAAGAAAAVVIVGLLGAGATRTSLLAVDRVDVSGGAQLSNDDIVKLSGVDIGSSIATLQTGQIESKLERQPWIERATVRRDWPHVVKISVTERRPVMLVQTVDGKWAQVGEGALVLAVMDAPVSGLPVPLGITAPSQPGARLDAPADPFVQIASALPKALAPQVTQMQAENGDYRLGLASKTIVELGDLRDLGDKLMAASAVISNTDPGKDLGILDVRSPHLPIATPKNPTTTTTQKPSNSTTSTTASTSRTTTTRKPSTTTTGVRTHSSTTSNPSSAGN